MTKAPEPPSTPNCTQLYMARSLRLNPAKLSTAFAQDAEPDIVRRKADGKATATASKSSGTEMGLSAAWCFGVLSEALRI